MSYTKPTQAGMPVLLILIMTLTSCSKQAKLQITDFGTVNNQKVSLYTIEFPNKLRAKVTNYGGIITALEVPDREGRLEDIVLGYDDLASYVEKTPYFGCILGRYGNRIAKGHFELNGTKYELITNNGPNHLHGGTKGFDKVVWQAKTKETAESVSLTLQYVSPDGEEGYPGTLTSTITYIFTENQLSVAYQATTDKATVVNLSQHTYFNLSACKEDILGHELQLNATQFLPVDSTSIPTGEFRKVSGTPFDFTKAKKMGQDIETDNLQLKIGNGYDHCFVLKSEAGTEAELAGSLYHPPSGRLMEIFTTEPGVQLYTANYLKGQFEGKNKQAYQRRYGLCLETQHFPDSPNQPDFPSTVLEVGEVYESETVFRFGIK